VILLGVGSMATYLSVKWTYNWQVYTGDPPLEGLGFSLVVVLFAVVVFEFAVQEAMGRHKRAILLFAMWAVVAVYSMQTTVAGQYIGVKKNEMARLEANREKKTAEVRLGAVELEMGILGSQEEAYKVRQGQLLKILGEIDTVEKRFEWRRNVEAMENELKKVNEELGRIAHEKAELARGSSELKAEAKIEELKGSGENVFAFYSEVLGVEDVSRVEFVLAVFRGVILDTVNILCFMFVMLRRSRKEGSLVQYHGVGRRNVDEVPVAERVVEDDVEESEPEEPSAEQYVKILAKDSFSPGRRNRSFTSLSRAVTLGVPKEVYLRIASEAHRKGAVVKRGGVLYRNELMDEEEFLREVLTEG